MHGGNLRKAQEVYGLTNFIDLSANINPFGPPRDVWDSLQKSLQEITSYPDPESIALRTALSQRLDQPMAEIMVGNGAGELIFTIVNALKPRKVAIPLPTFSEYERAARSIGAEVCYIPLGAEGWRKFQGSNPEDGPEGLDVSEFNRLWKGYLEGCELLFLCSPHNPTGSVLEAERFEQLLKLTRAIGCNILFDESFLDFLPDELRKSARTYLAGNKHLIVLYSLTKFYSLPGLRLGAAFASPAMLRQFEQYRDPWSVNVLAQNAGITALRDRKYGREVREKLQESRAYFYREFELCGFKHLRLLATAVNFSLLEILDSSTPELIRHLGSKGILVRNCRNFAGLQGNYLRVAIKDILAMQKLITELKAFYG
ncbi:pyridoxal phosphate-dependent class II aminotransferase [Desulfosporosinus sp. PR]|uniref:pyridoxal phosphate-dependent aminotransferase n=1 Tax=Candidatus Desulfosporosinus nitrosoreducens TaxID=3401928 RepID=UPI0027EA7176|nr:pyridoxal phosphate-dependent class II aminotransferase [Desulfosporosinus sp. PR]MDQ7093444.1 pyridoxal phosphate-dependent class II aminotransferase [Desulfosporosinus sp. PR]